MLVMAYIPCGSEEEAKEIGIKLVDGKVAACVNIITSDSISHWAGKLEKTKEWIILAKTLPERFDDLKKRVEELHSYDVPCITAVPIKDVNEEYLTWVKEQVGWIRHNS